MEQKKRHYYHVTITGTPEGPERTRLQQAFRAEMNRRFGSEEKAAAALHAHLDGHADLGARDEKGMVWIHAVQEVAQHLLASAGSHVVPDAQFECELDWVTIAGSITPSLPGEYLFEDAIGAPQVKVQVINDGGELVARFPGLDGDPGCDLLVSDMNGVWDVYREED